MERIVAITINVALSGGREVPHIACHLEHDKEHTIQEFAERCTLVDLYVANDPEHKARMVLRVVARHVTPAIVLDGKAEELPRFMEAELLGFYGSVTLETANWFIRHAAHNGYWNLLVRFNAEESIAVCTVGMDGVVCGTAIVPYDSQHENFVRPRLH